MATLRVVSWNVRSLRDDRSAVAAVLRELAPDVVCLQEAPRFLRWRHALAELARRSGLLVAGGGRTAGGPALLTALRVDVVETREVLLPRTRGLHQRGVAAAHVRVHGVPLLVASTHLGLDAAERSRHAGEVLDLLAHEVATRPAAGPPVVLGGDLNETADGPAWRALLSRGLRDAFAEAPSGGGPTFPARAPRRRIDAVLVDPRLELLGAGVPPIEGLVLAAASDHCPVVADVVLPARP